ncbi:MAG: HPr family phosphocarrier protein [Cellulomonadaceae bacterium]|nr:HPr family phosphocarrier protein [Cellulomonadaceae bacterium]
MEAGAVWAPAVAPAVQAPVGGVAADAVSAVVTLRNPHGLHARPAALLARVVSEAGTPVTVNGVDGASMLALMTLKVHQGSEVTIAAAGPLARRAVDTVVAAIEEGLGEA